ncbi:MAG: nucleotidyl transferase AbiEii/AbiGii toxin family protein [Clostridia bacterium]|nr:nucleotidyl transferase AbiEii/AbiGii toxin family protein [Clostridia bacterium]
MKNAMQLKVFVKKIAKEKNISAQLVMQNYMLERLLERISVSRYRHNFILKGGFLIAAMVGLDTRTTMDMDATIKGFPVNESTVRQIFEEICSIELDDEITFALGGTDEIREKDAYSGYRVSLTANYPPMKVPLKIDITTGDEITPHEIEYNFSLMLENRYISVLAYNLETVLAEKLETIISRGDQSTRPRDYYDVYILTKLQRHNLELRFLRQSLYATAHKRGSSEIVRNGKRIMETVKASPIMQDHWVRYQENNEYARDITFTEACDSVIHILNELGGF